MRNLAVAIIGLCLFSGLAQAQTHPSILNSAALQASRAQMKTDYDANPSAPATIGGQLYKLIKENADSGARYSDGGQWAAWMYLVTGDAGYVTKSWDRLSADPPITGWDGFLSRGGCETSFGNDYGRAYGWRIAIMYDWLYPGLTTEQRTELLDQLNALAACVDGTWRSADTDETTSYYLFVALLHALTTSYNSTINTIWNDAGREFGGYTPTGVDVTTQRNAIKLYVDYFFTGGVWIEGPTYNAGTLQHLMLVPQAIEELTGTDYFPEITALREDAALHLLHQMSPGVPNETTSQGHLWGDADVVRQIRSFAWIASYSQLAALNEGTSMGESMQDFVMDWFESETVATMDPLFDFAWVFDPYATRGDYTTTTTEAAATGMGIYTSREGWGAGDDWFMARFIPLVRDLTTRGGFDHFEGHYGAFEYWKNGAWAITTTQGYSGISADARGSNTVAVYGLPLYSYYAREYRAVTAYEREKSSANFFYIAGTQGGVPVKEGGYNTPPVTEMENTRSLIWLPDMSVAVTFDRVNSTTPDPANWLFTTPRDYGETRPLKDFYIQTPVAATEVGNYVEWAYSGSNMTRVTTLLPTSVTKVIENQATVWADDPFPGTIPSTEKTYQVRIYPDTTQQWDTFLHVWDVYDTGTPATNTLIQDTTNKVDAVMVTKGTVNTLLAFNAIQGPNLDPHTGGLYSTTWSGTAPDILSVVRIRNSGYSLTFTPAIGSTTKVILFDLDTGTEWNYDIDGGASSILTVDDQGVGIIDLTNTGEITLNVQAAGVVPVVVSTASLPNGTLDSAYSQALAATGGDDGPYTWTVTVGSLPSALSLSSGGTISGTPDTAETQAFTVQACDSTGPTCGTRALSLTIDDLPTITTIALDAGVVGTAYSDTVAVTGGTEPYVFTVDSGTLCDGLSLASGTGVISGTPTTVETCEFTILVTDDGALTDTQTFSIGVENVSYVTIRSEASVTGVVVHYRLANLPRGTSCTLDLKDGATVLDSVAATSGPSLRSTYFTGLMADTIYEMVVTCDTAVSAPGANFFQTLPSSFAGSGNTTVTYSIALKPNPLLTSAAKVRVSYAKVPLGIPVLTFPDTDCASGCTVDVDLIHGQVYSILHVWLDSGSNTIASSGTRLVAVP